MLIISPSRLATAATTITALSTSPCHHGVIHHSCQHHTHPSFHHSFQLTHECPLRQTTTAMKRRRMPSTSLSMSGLPEASSITTSTKILSNVVGIVATMCRGGGLGKIGESGIFGNRHRSFAELFSLPSSGSTAADAMLDLTRVQMRLDGLQVYATLAALLTNACLELYTNLKEPKEEADDDDVSEGVTEGESEEKNQRKLARQKRLRVQNWAVDIFYLCTVVSVLSGSYTTIVFGLFSILSKTALGRGLDASFIKFWSESAGIRNSGLESFLVALVSFEVAFLLSLMMKFATSNQRQRRRQILLVGIGTTILLISMKRWIKLLYLASKLLFPLWAEVEY